MGRKRDAVFGALVLSLLTTAWGQSPVGSNPQTPPSTPASAQQLVSGQQNPFAGTIAIPILQGGRVQADMKQAESALVLRRATVNDSRGRIEEDIENAILDLRAAARQVDTATAQRAIGIAEQGVLQYLASPAPPAVPSSHP